VTLPPGHYGADGRTPAGPVAAGAPEPLTWRWFLPRSRAGRILSAAWGAFNVLFMTALGLDAAASFAGLGLFVAVTAVPLRKAHPVGRVYRRDPAGAVLLGYETAHIQAVYGVIWLLAAAVAGAIFALSALLSG